MNKVFSILSVLVFVLFATAAHAQWQFVDLHPSNSSGYSQVLGVVPGQQAGYAEVIGPEASLWTGTAASRVSLGDGFILATDGTQQAGWALQNGLGPFAVRWVNGTKSFLARPSTADGSGVYGMYRNTFAGYVRIAGQELATYWQKPNKAIQLHPSSGYATSLAQAVYSGYQAGRVCDANGNCFAATWRGRASTLTILHPQGYQTSNIRGLHGTTGVGWVTDFFGQMRAGFWNILSGLFTEVSPGAWSSGLNAVSNNWAAGVNQTTQTSDGHAMVWDLTNSNNIFDLHAVLPAGQYISSAAFAISRDPNTGTTYVGGWAMNANDFQQHAILWILP